MSLRRRVKGLLRGLGWNIGRYDRLADPTAVRATLLAESRVDTVLDVGANAGQYGRQLRDAGFRGRIVSFEPLAAAHAALAAAAGRDPDWLAVRCALGAERATLQLNVAGNSWSSSLLPMLPAHRSAAPESAYVGVEAVTVSTLDEMLPQVCAADSRCFLKIDTQGYTLQVLAGASGSLARMAGLQLELSLVRLYADEPLMAEVLEYLAERGFRLVHVEPEFRDSRGFLLQVNGLFART